MPWTPPSDPVSGTVITVAYAVANLLTQIRWLRQMTGNADPPGTSYIPVSTSVSAVSWSKVPNDALATDSVDDRVLTPGAAIANVGALGVTNGNLATDSVDDRVLTPGAAVANIGYTPVNRGGDTMSGGLVAPNVQLSSGFSTWQWIASGVSMFLGIPGLNNPIELRSNEVRLTGTTITANASPIVTAANSNTTCDAKSVLGKVPTAVAQANAIPIADASGKLDSWVTASGGGGTPIPVGLGAWCRSAAEIPAGWLRETVMDGMMAIGDTQGAAINGQNLASGSNAGTSWSHGHTDSGHSHTSTAHAHSGALLGISGTVAASTATLNGRFTAGGANALPDNHTHDVGTLDVTGSTNTTAVTTDSGAATIGATSWLPPARVIVWIRKQ
jgi:hypothetical protein